MVKQGPIPDFVHSLIEYIAGVALIAAPLLLDYHSGAAKAVSIVLGVLVLFLVATTTSTMSLINQVPLSMHIVFDYVIAAVMIASPFLFSFSGESTPTAVFLAGGVVWLLLSIGTRYRKEEAPKRGEPKRRGRALPTEGGERGGAAAEQPSRERPAPDAVPDDSIPEFKPPPSQRE
jgi:VIT1/CCC1 family predicted Fe2+/Mn2+ transporter